MIELKEEEKTKLVLSGVFVVKFKMGGNVLFQKRAVNLVE
jgi:hypothetical protein